MAVTMVNTFFASPLFVVVDKGVCIESIERI